MSSNKFFKALFINTLFLVGVGLLVAKWVPTAFSIGNFLMMIAYVVLVISIVHLVLLKVSKGKPQKFIRVYMIAAMVKLLLYFIFILTMAFLNRDQAGGLLIGFLILYLSYATLEVYFLRKHLNSQGT